MIESSKQKEVHKSKDMILQEISKRVDQVFLDTIKDQNVTAIKKFALQITPPIKLTYKKTKMLQKGWLNKSKGIFQVLYERGYIDPTNIDKYAMKPFDENGNLDETYCLPMLLQNCEDFKNEMCQLEYIASNLNSRVIITPKYHAELAGEGIEYAWGVSKAVYRKIPWGERKGKQNFQIMVKKSLCNNNILNVENIRRFSQRARGYMLVYTFLNKNNDEKTKMKETCDCNINDVVTYELIEKMAKAVKTHRNIIDICTGYVKPENWVKNETKNK